MDYPGVLDVLVVVLAAFLFSCFLAYFCSPNIHREEEEERSADALAQVAVAVERTRTLAAREQARRLMAEAARVGQVGSVAAAAAATVEQARRLSAAAVAPAVKKKELGYFPYSGPAGVEASGQRLVCAICLEVFVPGATCSEVPACRHIFHRDCIGTWMKNSKSTCPLCRALIVPGSERLSAAEDMV